MNDADLIKELNALGIDEHSYRVLALLPLVQVAWADGEIQETERALILDLATSRYKLEEEARIILENWLAHAPTPAYVQRGHRVLVELAKREHGTLTANAVGDVVGLAGEVAKAAGGLFGFRAVDANESRALQEIAVALHIEPGRTWDPELFEEAPTVEIEEDTSDDPTDNMGADEMQKVLKRAHDLPHPDEAPGETKAEAVLVRIDDGASWPLVDEITIGRHGANTVKIVDDARISRFHVRISVDNGKVWLEDRGSQNGTWVNGERVTKRRLFGKEEIVVGSAAFEFLRP